MHKKPSYLDRLRHPANPVVFGTLCGAGAAIGYTAANICLRSVAHCDPVWVSAVKAFPTVVLIGPWVLWRMANRRGIVPSMRVFWGLVVAGLACQLFGNVIFQWALHVIGVGLTVPLTLGTMIAGGAALARWLLRERVSPKMLIAMSLLIGSIVVLSLGAPAAHRSVSESLPESGHDVAVFGLDGSPLMIAGVVAACFSGFAYCSLGVMIRHAANEGTPISSILIIVGVVGTVALGGLSLWRPGIAEIVDTTRVDLNRMLAAGICNAGAFLFLALALRWTGLIFVNALNASQAALAAIAGVLLFQEASSIALWVGVALTVLGLLLMRENGKNGSRMDCRSVHECGMD